MNEEHGTIIIEEERLRESFTMIPDTILKRHDITPGAKLTYTMLLHYARQDGACFPGQARLCADIGASDTTLRKWLRELVDTALVRVKRRGLGKTNIYTLARWVTPRSEDPSDLHAKDLRGASEALSDQNPKTLGTTQTQADPHTENANTAKPTARKTRKSLATMTDAEKRDHYLGNKYGHLIRH